MGAGGAGHACCTPWQGPTLPGRVSPGSVPPGHTLHPSRRPLQAAAGLQVAFQRTQEDQQRPRSAESGPESSWPRLKLMTGDEGSASGLRPHHWAHSPSRGRSRLATCTSPRGGHIWCSGESETSPPVSEARKCQGAGVCERQPRGALPVPGWSPPEQHLPGQSPAQEPRMEAWWSWRAGEAPYCLWMAPDGALLLMIC